MTELLEAIRASLGTDPPCDLLRVSDDVVLMVTHEEPVGVFRYTRGAETFHTEFILEREQLDASETGVLADYLSRLGVVWNPELLAAEFRKFEEG